MDQFIIFRYVRYFIDVKQRIFTDSNNFSQNIQMKACTVHCIIKFLYLFSTSLSLRWKFYALIVLQQFSIVKSFDNQRSNVRTETENKRVTDKAVRKEEIKQKKGLDERKDEGAWQAILDLLETLIAGAKRRKRRANRLA